jgi:GntR family transcriptional regulator, rspAB operon transcriptional repressor
VHGRLLHFFPDTSIVARLHRERIADAIFVREAIASAALPSWPPRRRSRRATALRPSCSAKRRPRRAANTPNTSPPTSTSTSASLDLAVNHHRVILGPIAEGDARAASRAMRLHIHSPLEFLEAIHRAHPEYFEEG